MRIRKALLVVGILAVSLAFVYNAQALLITPSTTPQWTGNQTSNAQIETAIASTISPSSLLYKSNVGSPEEGPLAANYTTSYFNSPTDPMDAQIKWDGGYFVGPTAFLLVKDGNHEPAWYLFQLTSLGWDGRETLYLNNFWPQQGAISHVALYGSRAVPEASTMLLLGAGLVAVAGIGRKKFKK